MIIKVQSMDAGSDTLRVAHVPVNVTILDMNDNAPMFVNLPYYAIVSIDAKKDELVTKVNIYKINHLKKCHYSS